ncbi:type II secretion system F family protein [Sphingorhabdus sp.]|jgi:tight adherence protein B|uniref:type II secretion system F family protein n=1 Tax=Sphingorhabdus sp. TaxID=1902408 RepID=UPI003BB1E9CA|nr:type II secretion system F family protein [Sphingomonadales bacterium]
MEVIAIFLGTAGVLTLLFFAFAGPNVGKATSRRLGVVKARHSDNATALVEQQMRKAIAARKPLNYVAGADMSRIDRLRLRLAKTGKKWTLAQYFYASAGIAFVLFAVLLFKGAPIYLGLAVGLLLGLGLPHFIVSFLINKRLMQFTTSFPDAIDLLVRGLRSGLPVSETLNVVAKEIPGPVGEEFRMVTEKIRIGKSMEDALQDTADRLGTAEFQFFVITLAIQRETGGNLSETLSNLSDVLRKRAQMKLKIRAMSSESKASAYIIGSLPFFVFGMVWNVNQKYLAGFFYEPRLIIAGLIGMVWMSIGAFIMAKMINFEI